MLVDLKDKDVILTPPIKHLFIMYCPLYFGLDNIYIFKKNKKNDRDIKIIWYNKQINKKEKQI